MLVKIIGTGSVHHTALKGISGAQVATFSCYRDDAATLECPLSGSVLPDEFYEDCLALSLDC